MSVSERQAPGWPREASAGAPAEDGGAPAQAGGRSIADHRALAFPDEPYSAYCRTCWNPVYALWIDRAHHGGACMHGHTRAEQCPDALARARTAAGIAGLRRQGLIR